MKTSNNFLQLTKENVTEALKFVKYPGFSRDIISFGLVNNVEIAEETVSVSLAVSTADSKIPQQLKNEVENAIQKLDGVSNVEVSVAVTPPKNQPQNNGQPIKAEMPEKLKNVKHIIAISSGKGGVGKSTFAVNLACALAKSVGDNASPKVGLMDCDIYGPSTPLMIGINSRPEIQGNDIVPLENFGVKVMSMGLLIDDDAPVVWRGPMVMKTISQFASNVAWGELEYLIIDLPPGTGDAQLSLVQKVPLSGAIVVTTPQTAAVNVALRGARMFDKVDVPVFGVAENMSFLENPQTGDKQYIFGEGGGELTAESLATRLLGQVPIDERIREGGDRGIPIVIGDPDCKSSQAFYSIAKKLANVVND